MQGDVAQDNVACLAIEGIPISICSLSERVCEPVNQDGHLAFYCEACDVVVVTDETHKFFWLDRGCTRPPPFIIPMNCGHCLFYDDDEDPQYSCKAFHCPTGNVNTCIAWTRKLFYTMSRYANAKYEPYTQYGSLSGVPENVKEKAQI